MNTTEDVGYGYSLLKNPRNVMWALCQDNKRKEYSYMIYKIANCEHAAMSIKFNKMPYKY